MGKFAIDDRTNLFNSKEFVKKKNCRKNIVQKIIKNKRGKLFENKTKKNTQLYDENQLQLHVDDETNQRSPFLEKIDEQHHVESVMYK
jgi:hypothetical protein